MTIPTHADKVFSWTTFDVYQREQELFDGSTKIFEKLHRNNTIDVVAISPDNLIYILEEQQPTRPMFYGLVWWTCESGESPLQTAQRELLEETWLISDDWILFNSYTLSSRIDYTSNIFIAKNCRLVDTQHLDPWWEQITVKRVTWDEFKLIVADPKFRVWEFALEMLRELYHGNEDRLKSRFINDV